MRSVLAGARADAGGHHHRPMQGSEEWGGRSGANALPARARSPRLPALIPSQRPRQIVLRLHVAARFSDGQDDGVDRRRYGEMPGLAPSSRAGQGRPGRPLAHRRRSSRLGALSDLMLRSPVVSAPMAARHLGLTARAAGTMIAELVDAGCIRELTGRSRYGAFGIL